MNQKPTVLAYLNGMPDVESTYPVLARLNARGRVNVKALIYSKLVRKEPRLLRVFEKYGLEPVISSKLRMKLLYQRDIREAESVLTIADPHWDSTTRKQRGNYMIKVKKPPIFLQHGVYQRGVNAPLIDEPMTYYSSRLLFWESLGENRKLFDKESQSKVVRVGFTKKDILPRLTPSSDMVEWLKKYEIKLLVCQSFRWGNGRHNADSIEHFYDLLDKFLARNKHVGVIIRSHRGKIRGNHRKHDKYLRVKHSNVVFSYQRSGPLAKYAIQDVVNLCDAMISPVSTTVLDALYMGRPVAVFEENLPLFSSLPRIDCLGDVERFIHSLNGKSTIYNDITEYYGNIDDNIESACDVIEADLGLE